MRLVMVAPFGLRPKGTARVRMLPLARALAARGHQVTMLVPPWDDRASAGRVEDHDGVTLRQLALPPHPLLDPPLLTLSLLRAARAAAPDLLHLFKPKAYSGLLHLGWWLRRAGAPVVVDSDDWEGAGGWNDVAGYPAPLRAFFGWQERWGLQHAAGVTVASRTLQQMVRAMEVPADRLLYLPNGPGAVWPAAGADQVAALRDRFGLGGARVVLLYTRFFEFDPRRLARRWARIAAAAPEAHLVVVGQGLRDEEAAFRAAARDLEGADRIVMAGWQPFESLPAWFDLADVALYPMDDTLLNRTKCPVKLADLLAAGVPVVGEGVGQVREYLQGEEGVALVPEGEDEAFAAAALALLSDPATAMALADRGRARIAASFDWPVAAARAERFYRRILDDSGA